MNWGRGIAIAMGLFMVFIVVLTVIKIQHVNHLEHEDYYDREVAYESEIQAQKNAQNLGLIEVDAEADDFLILRLPEEVEIQRVKVVLMRFSDKDLDREYVFENTKTILIPKEELTKGRYKIDVIYKIEDQACLIKKEVMI